MARTGASGGGRRLELIEYPEGEDIVDHKGRSKPIYKPSSPRPREWRPGLWSRWLMGLFPGLRLMVTKSVPGGLPYALLGLLAGLGALLVVLNWSVTADTMRLLRIQPRWILIRAGAALVLVMVYELLRLGASLEERTRGPRIPRALAAMVLPAFVVVFGAPTLLHAAPRFLEATWFAAVIVGFGALPAAVVCVLDDLALSGHSRTRARHRMRLYGGITLGLLLAIAVLLPRLGMPIFEGLSGAARAAGFRVLPALLP